MKFALMLYVAYCAFLVAAVWQHPTDVSIEACIFLGLFGAWFSRMMYSLDKINKHLLQQEHMHQLILQEHEHFWQQKVYREAYFTQDTMPEMHAQNAHREWATRPLYHEDY